MVKFVTYNPSTPNVDGTLAGVQFAGSPVVIGVKVEANTFPQYSSARRIVLRVVNADEPLRFETILQHAENGDVLTIDISSALRALLPKVEIDPNVQLPLSGNAITSSFSPPVLRYLLQVGYTCLSNGILYNTFVNEPKKIESFGQPCYAINGRLTELERLSMGHSALPLPGSFVTKPITASDPEIVIKDMWYSFSAITDGEAKRGDVNGDGDVNIADAMLVYQCVAEDLTIFDRPFADVNGDGYIDIADAMLIMNIVAGGDGGSEGGEEGSGSGGGSGNEGGEGSGGTGGEVTGEEVLVRAYSNNPTAGSVTGSGVYQKGSTVTVEAIANDGYAFSEWSDGSTVAKRTFVATQDISLEAFFTSSESDATATLTVKSADETMGAARGSGTYPIGRQVPVSALPNSGYKFDHWDDGVTVAQRTVTVLQDTTMIAYFSRSVGGSLGDFGGTPIGGGTGGLIDNSGLGDKDPSIGVKNKVKAAVEEEDTVPTFNIRWFRIKAATKDWYLDKNASDYKMFLFLNRLGVPETVCARTLESLSVDATPTTYKIEQPVHRLPTTTRTSHIFQPETYDKYEMSSGACSRAWARWWIKEFLGASQWWVAIGDMWIPCVVVPAKKSIELYNSAKAQALSINFTVTIDLSY